MGKRVTLTLEKIRRLAVDEGQSRAYLWDDEAPGLGVLVTANGTKSFIFQGRVKGADKELRLTIGSVDTWDIEGRRSKSEPTDALFAPGEGARQIARRLKGLCDAGIDPRDRQKEICATAEAKREAEQEAKEQREAQATAESLTVGESWQAYIAYQKDKMSRPNIERGKKWGERHLRDHECHSQPGGEKKKRGQGETRPGVLYPLMSMRMVDISACTLREWQRKEAEGRANNARQGYELFRAFWRWCATQPSYGSIIDPQAVESKELRDEVPGRKVKAADVLQREQLSAWFREVTKLAPVQSAYLQCLLLTGARREEFAALQWKDVDFKWDSLRIRDKVEGERTIPMTPYVKSLLLDLQARNNTPPPPTRILAGKTIKNDVATWQPSPWVFFSPTAAEGRIQEPREAHNRALSAAGLPHLSIHGLRRSFGTLAEWVEIPTGIVAQIMGHKPSAIAERHYRRRPLDLLRKWHTKLEEWILKEGDTKIPPLAAGIRFSVETFGLEKRSA